MDKENISFPESVISVAKIAHITIPGEYNNDAIYKKILLNKFILMQQNFTNIFC